VTDHFTKYACAFPTRTQHASVVAKILVENFIVHYGIPERLHSDQGANFESKVIKHLYELLGTAKSRTTPYHPQGDDITERFNRTLLSMLSTLDEEAKTRWKEHVAPLVHAYNSTRQDQDSTGYAPFFLMFGRAPRLPIDMFLGLTREYDSSVHAVRERLDTAYHTATEAQRCSSKRQTKDYDKKARGNKLTKGDFVLVKNVGLKGKCKLADRWRQERYVVEEQPNSDLLIYRLRDEKGKLSKLLHRNMLLPLTLPFENPVDYNPEPIVLVPQPSQDRVQTRNSRKQQRKAVESDDSQSEYDFDTWADLEINFPTGFDQAIPQSPDRQATPRSPDRQAAPQSR
jgi:hypothetical protein